MRRCSRSAGIDTRGIERAPGLSFHWTGAYAGTLNEAQTLGTDLNVFERFEPKIPEAYEDSEYLFLANIDPVLQARVRSQMPKVRHGVRRHDELLDQGPHGEPDEGAARAWMCC